MTGAQRTVAVVTGSRAEYGLLKSSMSAIRDHDDLGLQVVATGMHLSDAYGSTVEEILDDGFEIAATPLMLVEGDSGATMAKSLGVGVLAFVDTYQALEPDIVLVLGDRDEPLAATLAAAHMNLPVAHVHGGDAARGATIDESIRHAITKFAHLHFPATERSADRIRKLGEEAWRIEVVGAPGLDDVLDGSYATPSEIARAYGIDPDDRLVVVLQHPLSKHPERSGEQMRATLDAVDGFEGQLVCVYPNSDAGAEAMVEAIEARKEDLDMVTFKNLPRRHFLGLLGVADVLVGNSSSGIIEAPTLGLPVVDVGPRQEDRERAGNTVPVPHDVDEIRAGIRRALDKDFRTRAGECESPYERRGAGRLIADRLASVDVDDELLQKRLTY